MDHMPKEPGDPQVPIDLQAPLFVVTKIAWTPPSGEPQYEYDLISVPMSTDLDKLRAQIQASLGRSGRAARQDWTVRVDVFDLDHLPPGAIPEGTSLSLSANESGSIVRIF